MRTSNLINLCCIVKIIIFKPISVCFYL
jgi:hypothetical protein